MPRNFSYHEHRGGMSPQIQYGLNGKSITILAGAPVVITSNATYTTSSYPVIRALLAADVSASYAEGGSNAGILGFAAHYASTTSGGVASGQDVYASKSAQAEPIFPLPAYGMGIDADININYTRIKVFLATPDMVFRGKLGGGGTTTATGALINTKAGIDIAAGPIYTVDTSESVKPLTIVGWDENAPTYVYFTVQTGFCQYLTGINYTSQ